MSLWLCLRFEQLPLQCLNRSENHPIVVVVAQRVLRANDCAAALGICKGMSAATVRALAPDEPVQFLERDAASEQACLAQLSSWAYSITPTLRLWRDDCLQLEIEGCLTLFRGLKPLLNEVSSGIDRRGFNAHIGLAPTPTAAWLLSFAADDQSVDLQRPLTERLADLPLSLLTDFSKTVDSLRRAGLHNFSDLLSLPHATLARRCGRDFTDFLQRALGHEQELCADYQPPATFSDEYWFGYDVKTNAELLPAVQNLLQSLCRFLRNTQLRSSTITWRLIGIDKTVHNIDVCSTSSHSNWENWYQLCRIRFERLALTNSVEGLELVCESLLPGEQESIDLFAPRNQREPLTALLDRLRSRLGMQAIETVGCRDEHLPELAVFLSNDQTPGILDASPPGAQRPFWLMPEPQPITVRDRRLYWSGALDLLYGPERIEDNWWRKPVCRDYYIAVSEHGQHYWVFCERLSRRWFIQGIFA